MEALRAKRTMKSRLMTQKGNNKFIVKNLALIIINIVGVNTNRLMNYFLKHNLCSVLENDIIPKQF